MEEESVDVVYTVGNSAVDVEAQIKSAMVARVPYFEKQADSLTFEGVRRLIETDLGMEKHALDVHKSFIKNCLQECLDGSETADASHGAKKIEQNVAMSDEGDAVKLAEAVERKKETVESVSETEDKMEDLPVMGLLTTQKVIKADTEGTEGNQNKGDITESIILKAIMKRASYFRANAEKVTMAGVRRLLEEDLELEKRTLDPFKHFVGKELEKVLEAPEVSKSAKPTKEKNVKKLSKTKSSKELSDGSGADSSVSEEEEAKPRKKTAAKGRMASDAVKKRKTPFSKEKTPSKRIKRERATPVSIEDKEHGSGDGSQSSVEKHPKKKEVSAPVYSKCVERLKSIIKACGLGVPPSIYKKVKQGPEDQRDARLIKELEEILSKEGLSANPSEKEIKDVKRKKERARELEGIDTSNIVSNSRRRSTSSYVPPPKPKIAVESEGEESEESEEEEDDENNDDDDDDNNDDDDDDNNEESQGEDASEGEEASYSNGRQLII